MPERKTRAKCKRIGIAWSRKLRHALLYAHADLMRGDSDKLKKNYP